jgi:SHS2 domain-containing protein
MSGVRTDDTLDPRRPVHARDLYLEAWAPTREECVAEAVRALLCSFVGAVSQASSPAHFMIVGRTDVDLLLGVLRTVIEHIRTRKEIPVAMKVVTAPDGLLLHCEVVDVGGIVPIGAIPKGLSEKDVRCESWPGGWWCTAKVDV